jgi:hypothetical protein
MVGLKVDLEAMQLRLDAQRVEALRISIRAVLKAARAPARTHPPHSSHASEAPESGAAPGPPPHSGRGSTGSGQPR